MKKTYIFLAIIFISVSAGAYAMGEKAISGTWKYKITVEIETPEGIKSGSAVREISNSVPTIDLPDVGNAADVRGEAVVIDLGNRGTLFALISDRSDEELYKAFPTQGPSTAKGIQYYNTLKPGMKADLKTSHPTMVMFKDINDPKSVTLVYGHRFDIKEQKEVFVDNFESIFVTGIKLKGITIEITDQPLTKKIDKLLSWLVGLTSNIDGTSATFSNELSNVLHVGNFRTGKY
jgi:hypothetical protein